jgi:hypothetical protein
MRYSYSCTYIFLLTRVGSQLDRRLKLPPQTGSFGPFRTERREMKSVSLPPLGADRGRLILGNS